MRNRTVNAKTGLLAILGDPISHAMSPVIMNASFDRLEMDKAMLAVRANLSNLRMLMPALREMGLEGYVFTMPVKEGALAYMDELNKDAQIIGAVNCACYANDCMIGYNTDSLGFWNAVQANNLENKRLGKLFLLGMGGLSRAAAAQAALQGVEEIVVANRLEDIPFVESFRQFTDRLRTASPETRIRILDWKPELWGRELENSDVVANGTPNGMNGQGDLERIFPYEALQPDTILFDAIYEPRFTRFLEVGRDKGFVIVEGLDLLVHQGVISFGIWTGASVDPATMKKDILDFQQTKEELL